jgi:hypothetical protein
MNFIIQENLTLDIEHPINFCQDLQNNLETLIIRNYCNKFINNRFYVKVLEIVGNTDVFIQCNNSGMGSITCIVKFQCILYTQYAVLFDLDVISTEINKNITIHKCTSSRYPGITFMAPNTEKINNTIPMGKIMSIGINKASENIIIFDIINSIDPILLSYDFSEELKNSKINDELLSKLNKSSSFNKLFSDDIEDGNDFIYIKGTIRKGSSKQLYQNLINISDKELCWTTLENLIYNFVNY